MNPNKCRDTLGDNVPNWWCWLNDVLCVWIILVMQLGMSLRYDNDKWIHICHINWSHIQRQYWEFTKILGNAELYKNSKHIWLYNVTIRMNSQWDIQIIYEQGLQILNRGNGAGDYTRVLSDRSLVLFDYSCSNIVWRSMLLFIYVAI